MGSSMVSPASASEQDLACASVNDLTATRSVSTLVAQGQAAGLPVGVALSRSQWPVLMGFELLPAMEDAARPSSQFQTLDAILATPSAPAEPTDDSIVGSIFSAKRAHPRGENGRFRSADGSAGRSTPNYAVRGPDGRFHTPDRPAADAAPRHDRRGTTGRFVRRSADGAEVSADEAPRHAVRGARGRFVRRDSLPVAPVAPLAAVAAAVEPTSAGIAPVPALDTPDTHDDSSGLGRGHNGRFQSRAKRFTSGGTMTYKPPVDAPRIARKKARPAVSTLAGRTERAGDAITMYFNEIGQYERLTRDEEVALSMKSLDESLPAEERKAAQDVLVEANLRLVVAICRDFVRARVTLPELLSVGNEGLIVASQRFDFREKVPFANYAAWWIRQRCLRYIAEHGLEVRVPTYKSGMINQVTYMDARLRQTLDRAPTAEEIVTAINARLPQPEDEIEADAPAPTTTGRRSRTRRKRPITVENVREILALNQSPLELDAPLANESDATTHGAYFGETVSDAAATVDATLDQIDMERAVAEALDRLRPREREVICWHYGLEGSKAMDLERIAARLGVTRERARQIKTAALATLREHPALQRLMPDFGLEDDDMDGGDDE